MKCAVAHANKLRVIIVGAGPGGLTLAAALIKKGMNPVVLEKSPAIIESSCFMLGGNGAIATKAIGLHSFLEPYIHVIKGQRFMKSNGNLLLSANIGEAEFYGKNDVPKFGLMKRGDFCKVALGQLPEGTVRFNSCLKGVTQSDTSVIAELADGCKVEGDILVGADGVGSKVRETIFPNSEKSNIWSGYTLSYGLTDRARLAPHEIPPENEITCVYNKEYYGVLSPLDSTTVYWAMYKKTPDEPPNGKWYPRIPMEEAQAELLKLAKGSPAFLQGPIRETGTLISTSHWVHPKDYLSQVWHRGRVVLMGDAAHKTMPFTGQGLNSSLDDALSLARIISERHAKSWPGGFDAAFGEYHQNRYQVTEKTREHANIFGRFQFPPTSTERAIRYGLFKGITLFGLNDRFSKLFRKDVMHEDLTRCEARKYEEVGQVRESCVEF